MDHLVENVADEIAETKEEVVSLFKYLKNFIKNPVLAIQKLPKIPYNSLLILQFLLCTISVVISNLLAPYAISLGHLVLSVAVSILALSFVTLFYYYFFLFFMKKELSFRKIFALVLFAHMPFAAFHLGAYLFPPVDIVGLAISCYLMIVGLIANFGIEKKKAQTLMISLYSLFFVAWLFKISYTIEMNQISSPQNLDQIEREVQSDL